VDQALDGTTDNDLLDVIRKASGELTEILENFDDEFCNDKELLVNPIEIQPSLPITQNGELRDMASNQVGAE